MRDRELRKRLRAIREPAPSPGLRVRLEEGIPGSFRRPERGRAPGRAWTMARIGTATAVGVAITVVAAWLFMTFVLGPASTAPAYAAVLETVAEATGEAGAVHMVLRMLTREGEDFPYVNLEGDLQEVEVWLQNPLQPGDRGRARVEKPDRIYCFDGKETIFYHPTRREATRGPGMYGGLDLFWPAGWVRQILHSPSPGVEVLEHVEADGTGRLVVREKGAEMGGRAPSSIGEFDRETEVVWDLATRRLAGLRRWVLEEGGKKLFAELVSIEYLPLLEEGIFTLDLPPDVTWAGVKEASTELALLGPREVAQRFFQAATEGDQATLEQLLPSPWFVKRILRFRVTRVEYLGEPFRSGTYPGVFVPYRVEYRRVKGAWGVSSGTAEHNLALRDDNPQRRWVVDGGIGF